MGPGAPSPTAALCQGGRIESQQCAPVCGAYPERGGRMVPREALLQPTSRAPLETRQHAPLRRRCAQTLELHLPVLEAAAPASPMQRFRVKHALRDTAGEYVRQSPTMLYFSEGDYRNKCNNVKARPCKTRVSSPVAMDARRARREGYDRRPHNPPSCAVNPPPPQKECTHRLLDTAGHTKKTDYGALHCCLAVLIHTFYTSSHRLRRPHHARRSCGATLVAAAGCCSQQR